MKDPLLRRDTARARRRRSCGALAEVLDARQRLGGVARVGGHAQVDGRAQHRLLHTGAAVAAAQAVLLTDAVVGEECTRRDHGRGLLPLC